MSLFDKILQVLDKYQNLIKRCDNGIMGKHIDFEINHKKYFLLINDNLRDYNELPWLIKILKSADNVGCYSIYKGEYSNAHWDLLTKDAIKNKKERLTRLMNIDKLHDKYSSGDISNKEIQREIDLSKLEEEIDKLLEK